MRIFLDANIFVAASGSDTGGSRYLFRIAEREHNWHLLTSAYVVNEARVNVRRAFPSHQTIFEQLITALPLTIVHDPPPSFFRIAQAVISPKDVPILAVAAFTRADFLCTLDQKDFHTPRVQKWSAQFNMKIVFPKDLLLRWRRDKRS